jgi:hypothetical protein
MPPPPAFHSESNDDWSASMKEQPSPEQSSPVIWPKKSPEEAMESRVHPSTVLVGRSA